MITNVYWGITHNRKLLCSSALWPYNQTLTPNKKKEKGGEHIPDCADSTSDGVPVGWYLKGYCLSKFPQVTSHL